MRVKYIPISCTFYDRLEAWSVQNQLVELVYREEADEVKLTARISTLQAKDGVEYAILDTGLRVRLDQLISVNGIFLEPAC